MSEKETNIQPAEATTVAAEIIENPLSPKGVGLLDSYRQYYKMATEVSKSELIPQSFRGKPMDIAIAFDMAARMGVSPLVVMQNLYVVKGTPSWKGQACISLIRNKFKNVKHIYVGEKGKDTYGCYVQAINDDGEVIKGPEVTIAMARSEGWMSNSKWTNMPDLMLAYRSASFFARINCPETLMGMSVEGELETGVSKKRLAEDVL